MCRCLVPKSPLVVAFRFKDVQKKRIYFLHRSHLHTSKGRVGTDCSSGGSRSGALILYHLFYGSSHVAMTSLCILFATSLVSKLFPEIAEFVVSPFPAAGQALNLIFFLHALLLHWAARDRCRTLLDCRVHVEAYRKIFWRGSWQI